jgi:hypothetical protein
MARLPPLPPFPKKQPTEDVPSSAERQRLCEICGQVFSTDNLDEVFHHGPEPHEPMAPQAIASDKQD